MEETPAMTTARIGEPPPARGPRPRPPAILRVPAAIARDGRELVRYWPVVQNMVVQELRVRYHRSVLGFLWTLIHPIMMMITMAVVFSQILHLDIKDYAIYLFAGLVPWGFLSGALTECSTSIVNNESLIRRIYLPKLVFPLSRVLINVVTLCLSLVALFLMLKPLGARFSLPMTMLPLVIGIWAAFGLGLGLVVATANTFYRDCGHLLSVVLQAWYFLSPILYEPKTFGDRQWLFWLNPATPFFRLFQIIIRDGQWPDPSLLAVSTAIAAASLGIGYALFKSTEDQFVFRL